ncbi:Asp-tRNA(Asn)/Glu-tRNA(Gln) amidotransferase subunit GatC [Lactococcus nasutitermitis]|uniref:Aspartyl/glutamyl-tRNA(Asn/Gln) amidotransferase subunit C n=1 Tax=Lactococcus nasutitermitis TaxID=1652957 RepID=A0ABV9JEA1_9LACT|nr:Asp-tRNA(Asn)/Glu-tRNA(Gln) amidotransferase subunit GatC [Lactococcus nasutitermitis]
MSQITTEQVKHVATLAKLEFPENEIQGFTDTLGKIIDMIETLNEVDTTGVDFTMNVADNLSRMREDVAVAGWNREALLKNVPTTENGFIQVPAMIADGGDA